MTENITINDGSADQDFVVTKTLPDGRDRINDSTSLLAPEILGIRHKVVRNAAGNPGGYEVDRHLISLSHVVRDTDETPYTATVNLTLVVPRFSSFDSAQMTKLITMVKNFALAQTDGLLRNES